MNSLLRGAAAAAALTFAAPLLAQGETIYETADPGGAFGYWGPDVYEDQSVAARFTVETEADVALGRIGIWLMNNSYDENDKPSITITLRTDALDEGGSESIPSETIIESWTFDIQAVGWDPVEEFVESTVQPMLQAGRNYWVVAESEAPALEDPVWPYAASGTGVSSLYNQGYWYPAAEGAALSMSVEAADDGSGGQPGVSISVTPATIVLGESAVVDWSVDDTRRCTALGDWSGRKAASGSEAIQPDSTGVQTFALSCRTAEGRVSGSAKLRVKSPN